MRAGLLLTVSLLTLGLYGSLSAPAAGATVRPAPLHPQPALQFGHTQAVNAVAVSPDGATLASGGDDCTIRIWDLRDGSLERVLEVRATVLALNFSPDGAQLAAGLRDSVRVWNTRTWADRLTLTRNGWLHSACFSSDGKTVLGAAADYWQTWSAETGCELRSSRSGGRFLTAVLSPDARWVATGGAAPCPRGTAAGGVVTLWNTTTGEPVRSLRDFTGPVTSVAFSRDGRYLLAADELHIRKWDLETGEAQKATPLPPGGPALCFSMDRRRFALASSSGDLSLRGIGEEKPAWAMRAESGPIRCMALSPDSSTLVVGTRDGKLTSWNSQSGTLRREFSEQSEGIASLAFSPDGTTLATGGGQIHGRVHLWNTRTGELRVTPGSEPGQGHLGWVLAVAFSPDGRMLATGGSRYTGEVKLWDARTGSLLRTLAPGLFYVRCLAFPPWGNTLAVGTYGGVRLFDATTGVLLRTLEAHQGWVNGLAFSPSGDLLATASADGTVKLWNAHTGALVRTVIRHEHWMTSVAFSPDGARLAAGSWDGTARVWDVATGGILHVLKRGDGDVNCVTFSPDGRMLATGHRDRAIRLWDVPTGSPLASLPGHEQEVLSLAFSPDGNTLASGGPDGILKLWTVAPTPGSAAHPRPRLMASLMAMPETAETRPIKADGRPIKADGRGLEAGALPHLGSEEYLAVSPEGYYASTPAADRHLRFRIGQTLYPAECFQQRYYRPEIIRRTLAGQPTPLPPKLRGPVPPRVSILSPSTGTAARAGTNSVLLEAADDSRLARVELFVDGVAAAARSFSSQLSKSGDSAARATPFTKRVRLAVNLPPGGRVVKLQAIAIDEDGLSSPRQEVQLLRQGEQVASGRMLGLCVGVSRYRDPRLTLKYADRDAVALAGVLRRQSQLYRSCDVRTLTNEDATRVNILQALDRLSRMTQPSDTVFVFLAGHGWRDGPRDFYFAPRDIERKRIHQSAIAWPSVVQRLSTIARRAHRVVVLLDACHSGSAATNAELVRAVLEARAGVLIFTASRGSELSLESPDLRQGLFTTALLEALNGSAAEPGEKNITVWGLATYVKSRVKELSGGAQSPQVPFLEDFDTDAPLATH